MKNVCKKIANVLKYVFGWGVMLSLFAGGLTFFGYVAALIIGGDAAAAICEFISKSFMPWVIRGSTVLVLLGLVTMYLSGEQALTIGKKASKHDGER